MLRCNPIHLRQVIIRQLQQFIYERSAVKPRVLVACFTKKMFWCGYPGRNCGLHILQYYDFIRC